MFPNILNESSFVQLKTFGKKAGVDYGTALPISYNNFLTKNLNIVYVKKNSNNINYFKKKANIKKEYKYRTAFAHTLAECMSLVESQKSQLLTFISNTTADEERKLCSQPMHFSIHEFLYLCSLLQQKKERFVKFMEQQLQTVESNFKILSDILPVLPTVEESTITFDVDELLKSFQQPSKHMTQEIQFLTKILEVRRSKIITEDSNHIRQVTIEFYNLIHSPKPPNSFQEFISFCRKNSSSQQEYNQIFDECISIAWSKEEFPFLKSQIISLEQISQKKVKEIIPFERGLPEFISELNVKDIDQSWPYFPAVELLSNLSFEIDPRKMVTTIWDACSLIASLNDNHTAGFDEIFPIFAICFSAANIAESDTLCTFVLDFTSFCKSSPRAEFVNMYMESLRCMSQHLSN